MGTFLDVEVVLEEDQTAEQGKEIAADILQHFRIRECDLIANAYADLLK